MSGATASERACAQCGGPSERFFCSDLCHDTAFTELRLKGEADDRLRSAAPALRDALRALLVKINGDARSLIVWPPGDPEVAAAHKALRAAGEEV